MKSNPSNNQFDTYIPKKISRYSNLNVSEMRVLAIITGLHKKNKCNARNKSFAEKTGLSISQVSRTIKSLSEKGYIEVDNPKSFNREIRPIEQGEVVEEKTTQEQEPTKVKEVPTKEPAKEEKKVVSLSSKKNDTGKSKAKSSKKNDTGKSNAEKGKFFGGYSHEFNYTQLEQLETQYVEQQSHAMHHDNLSDRAKELLLQVHIDEEPSEWLGVNQLKI